MVNSSKQKDSQVFSNPVLDKLMRSHPAYVIGLHLPIAGGMLYYFYTTFISNWSLLLGLCLLGIFAWTLAEYLMHRYLYHFIRDNKWIKKLHYFMHGHHHEHPRDKSRLALPLIPSIFLAIFFFSLFWLLMGTYAFVFYPGFVMGYLSYMMLHYLIHTTQPPRYLYYIWKHHNIHHFQEGDRAYGVSNPLWDLIFGTMPREFYQKKQKKKKS